MDPSNTSSNDNNSSGSSGNDGSKDPTKWNKNPSKESHMWWPEYSMNKKRDNCPRCQAREELVNTTETVRMMYGIVKERLCTVCHWTWTLRIADEGDD